MLVKGGSSAPGDADMVRSPGDSVVSREDTDVLESLVESRESCSAAAWLF